MSALEKGERGGTGWFLYHRFSSLTIFPTVHGDMGSEGGWDRKPGNEEVRQRVNGDERMSKKLRYVPKWPRVRPTVSPSLENLNYATVIKASSAVLAGNLPRIVKKRKRKSSEAKADLLRDST